MELRKARLSDVGRIHQLISKNAQKNLMLPRALSELYEHLRDYQVAIEDGNVVGVCGLTICWEDLAEIRSLAVEEDFRNRGIGKRLVESCLKEAEEIGIKRVFALTNSPSFFLRLGFSEIQKEELPHKIWADCVKCPKFPKCDEVALIYKIEKEA